jgi:5-deoxy-D-glucuronate isomerase
VTSLADHHRLPDGSGVHDVAACLEHLRFSLVRLAAGEEANLRTADDETLLVVLEASEPVRVEAGSREVSLPARASVFRDLPGALYAPAGTRTSRLWSGARATSAGRYATSCP